MCISAHPHGAFRLSNNIVFFSCQVQQEVLQKRQKEKKAMMEAVKSYKKRKYRHACGDITDKSLKTGFVRVMENLESHGILEFHFPGLESHGF